MDALIDRYNIKIYITVNELIKSGKKIDDFDLKKDLYQIFKWFVCIKLSQERNMTFYSYEDIPIAYKKEHHINKYSHINACNLIDTIVLCTVKKNILTVEYCANFFASNLYRNKFNKIDTQWNYLIIARNNESKLFHCLNKKLENEIFDDKPYSKEDVIEYCKFLMENPPQYSNDFNMNNIESDKYDEEFYDSDEEKYLE